MAYNPFEAASNILNLKGQWEKADEQNKKRIAETARKYYKDLVKNNFGDIAETLNSSNYTQAKNYVGSLANNPDHLHNVNVRTSGNMIGDAWNKNTQYSDDIMDFGKAGITGTRDYRNIMDGYLALGENAGYNAIASGSGRNAGNVDSFSRANADRQLKAFRTAGEEAARQAWIAQAGVMDNARGGYNAQANALIDRNLGLGQQIFDNNQTDLLNRAATTGIVPTEWAVKDNPYIINGKVDENQDYQHIYETAKAAGDEQTATWAQQARYLKYQQDPEKYQGFIDEKPLLLRPQSTADMINANADRDLTKYGFDTEAATDRHAADTALAAARDTNSSSLQATQNTNAANLAAQQGVDAVNREKAQIEKEIALMSDPVNQIQYIQNSTLDEATKNALIARIANQMSGGNRSASESKVSVGDARNHIKSTYENDTAGAFRYLEDLVERGFMTESDALNLMAELGISLTELKGM
jgi:hypothetical protein